MLLKKKQDKAVDEETEKKKLEEEYSQSAIEKAKEAVIKALDQNGNGQLEIEDLIILVLKTSSVYINRAEFLKNGLFKNHTEVGIYKAIEIRPVESDKAFL